MSSCISIERAARSLGRAALCGLFLASGALPVQAGSVALPVGSGRARVRAESLEEAKFRTTVRQEHDFSCGAAAVATLLTHHYGRDTVESEVFRYMWEAGDQKRIQSVGFSLLDMKRFLNVHGYEADGYRITLDQLAQTSTPAITLISTLGYRHFVVIEGVSSDEVLISDPAVGARALPRRELDLMRDPVALVIPPHASTPRRPLQSSWQLRPAAPVRSVRGLREFGRDAFRLPWTLRP